MRVPSAIVPALSQSVASGEIGLRAPREMEHVSCCDSTTSSILTRPAASVSCTLSPSASFEIGHVAVTSAFP